MALSDISVDLISVAEDVLKFTELNKDPLVLEGKSGRKYKQVEGRLIRVKKDNKQLWIGSSHKQLEEQLSVKSSYFILSSLGDILERFREICLVIMFTAREIEINKWYDQISKVYPDGKRGPEFQNSDEQALKYIQNVTNEERLKYVEIGCQILTSTVTEFFHTDHFTSKRTMESTDMQKILMSLCDENLEGKSIFQECADAPEVLQALTALSHWVSIKGVLHASGMNDVNMDNELYDSFQNFPQSPQWLVDTLFQKYPAGTTKASLIKDCLLVISQSPVYGRLISVPEELNVKEFIKLCDNIETCPTRYHIRSSAYNLSNENPLDINRIFPQLNNLLLACGAIIHGSGGEVDPNIAQAPRFPDYQEVRNHKLFSKASKLRHFKSDPFLVKEVFNSFSRVVGGAR